MAGSSSRASRGRALPTLCTWSRFDQTKLCRCCFFSFLVSLCAACVRRLVLLQHFVRHQHGRQEGHHRQLRLCAGDESFFSFLLFIVVDDEQINWSREDCRLTPRFSYCKAWSFATRKPRILWSLIFFFVGFYSNHVWLWRLSFLIRCEYSHSFLFTDFFFYLSFLKGFLELYPDYIGRPTWFAGESYGGSLFLFLLFRSFALSLSFFCFFLCCWIFQNIRFDFQTLFFSGRILHSVFDGHHSGRLVHSDLPAARRFRRR